MIQIDLITGFLGSGKTTFIKQYAQYLMDKGMNIGILENDFGAVNVDMMLLQDMEGENCTLEMVAGGCDKDCHRRRFKTKLIAMGMCGYDRVLVEPSGIFDVDEFYDALYEEPLNRWYEIGNIFAIVNGNLENDLSDVSEFMLASQLANAGTILLSRLDEALDSEVEQTISHMNKALNRFGCDRVLDTEIIKKSWSDFDSKDYEKLLKAGYKTTPYRKEYQDVDGYQSLYFMNGSFSMDELQNIAEQIFKDSTCGTIFRMKGFFSLEGNWYELNATSKGASIHPVSNGQEIIIVIGEHLNQEAIENWMGMKANEL